MNYTLNATPKKLSFSYNLFSIFKEIVKLLNSFNNSFFQYLSSVLATLVIANNRKNEPDSHHCKSGSFSYICQMPMDVYLSKMVPVRNGAALFMTFIRM